MTNRPLPSTTSTLLRSKDEVGIIEAPGLAVGGFCFGHFPGAGKMVVLDRNFFALDSASTSAGRGLGLTGIIIGVAHILIFQWRQENKSPVPVERYGGELQRETLLAAAPRP